MKIHANNLPARSQNLQSPFCSFICSAICFFILFMTPQVMSENLKSSGAEWCGTTAREAILNASRRQDPNACVAEGVCDDPLTRNTFAVGPGTPTYVIQLYIHVFRNDNGTNAAASASDVAATVAQLNSDFAPSGIQFEYQMRFVNSSLYRDLLDAEEVPMKTLYAIQPDSFLNVYVLSLASVGLLGYAYTPWQANSQTTTGGCVVTDIQNGGFGAGTKTLTHEIGHNLGLHHTQRGVSEVTQCSGCYESPGLPDNDLRGDFCDDTRPTPTNFNCSDPAGSSPCNGQAWAPTPINNYMGYAPDFCYNNFSPKQMSRMRCWVDDELLSWTRGVSFSVGLNFGPVPLTVSFNGQSSSAVSSWSWDFGDGGTSTLQNPTHTYTVGGTYDVSVTAQTTGGPEVSTENDAVYAHADTLRGDTAQVGVNEIFQFPVYADNKCPLTSLIVPVTWAGPLSLVLQSATLTGTRASAGTLSTVASSLPQKINVYSITMPVGTPIQPGNGPVLMLTFKAPFIQLPGVNQIAITPLLLNNPTHTTIPGSYAPITINGAVTMGCCRGGAGNVNNDTNDDVDVLDLTLLVDHLFIGFSTLPCPDEANCDRDAVGSVDVLDLTLLVDHLFVSFAPLPNCS